MAEYCVTGGTGFIAAYLVKALLEKGHTVRTTVRDPEDESKVEFLRKLSGAKERLKIMKADLMVEGSFDDAIEGVDGVFHTASPVLILDDDNVEETLIDPCIKGTLNVLKSCSKASTVKRVVLTSSCSCIRYRDDVQEVSPLNESHWSDVEYCKRYNLWYAYAKTIAEKEAWRVAEENGMDLVVVNPSFVVGPLLTPQPTSTLLIILSIMKGLRGEYPNFTVGFVHIEDVVAAHILAMEEKKASGRLVCSNSVAHWSEIIEMLRTKYPQYPFENKEDKVPDIYRHTRDNYCRRDMGTFLVIEMFRCSSQKGDNNPHSMDSSKILNLGLAPLKSLDQMFDDCIKSFRDKGFL